MRGWHRRYCTVLALILQPERAQSQLSHGCDLLAMWRHKVAAASSRCAEAGSLRHVFGFSRWPELAAAFTCFKGHTPFTPAVEKDCIVQRSLLLVANLTSLEGDYILRPGVGQLVDSVDSVDSGDLKGVRSRKKVIARMVATPQR